MDCDQFMSELKELGITPVENADVRERMPANPVTCLLYGAATENSVTEQLKSSLPEFQTENNLTAENHLQKPTGPGPKAI